MTDNCFEVSLIPYGSFKVGESRDEDFVAFPAEIPEGLKQDSTEVWVNSWDKEEIVKVAQSSDIENPDIWIFNQEGDMKPIIVANLVKDYPSLSEWIQETMGLHVDISGNDAVLLAAMDANVKRWEKAPPHLPNLRKRVFSKIQRDAYVKSLGFFNTKSEISEIAPRVGKVSSYKVKSFLMGSSIDSDESILDVLRDIQHIKTYKSLHKCIAELSILKNFQVWRTYITPIITIDGMVFVFLEEIFTDSTFFDVAEIETDVWTKLVEIDLQEVK